MESKETNVKNCAQICDYKCNEKGNASAEIRYLFRNKRTIKRAYTEYNEKTEKKKKKNALLLPMINKTESKKKKHKTPSQLLLDREFLQNYLNFSDIVFFLFEI